MKYFLKRVLTNLLKYIILNIWEQSQKLKNYLDKNIKGGEYGF
jgi:hypothetical protein